MMSISYVELSILFRSYLIYMNYIKLTIPLFYQSSRLISSFPCNLPIFNSNFYHLLAANFCFYKNGTAPLLNANDSFANRDSKKMAICQAITSRKVIKKNSVLIMKLQYALLNDTSWQSLGDWQMPDTPFMSFAFWQALSDTGAIGEHVCCF